MVAKSKNKRTILSKLIPNRPDWLEISILDKIQPGDRLWVFPQPDEVSMSDVAIWMTTKYPRQSLWTTSKHTGIIGFREIDEDRKHLTVVESLFKTGPIERPLWKYKGAVIAIGRIQSMREDLPVDIGNDIYKEAVDIAFTSEGYDVDGFTAFKLPWKKQNPNKHYCEELALDAEQRCSFIWTIKHPSPNVSFVLAKGGIRYRLLTDIGIWNGK